jgi:hypothetical protein
MLFRAFWATRRLEGTSSGRPGNNSSSAFDSERKTPVAALPDGGGRANSEKSEIGLSQEPISRPGIAAKQIEEPWATLLESHDPP